LTISGGLVASDFCCLLVIFHIQKFDNRTSKLEYVSMQSNGLASDEKVKHLNIFLQQRLTVINSSLVDPLTPVITKTAATADSAATSQQQEPQPDEQAKQIHKRVTSQINLMAGLNKVQPKPSEIVQLPDYPFQPGEYLDYL